jgi:2'-5' RNA ligase
VRDGRAALVDLGVSLSPLSGEDRPYQPHVTLARVNRARDLRAAVEALDARGESEPWTVEEIVLFDSDTRPDGAVHTERARFRLAG